MSIDSLPSKSFPNIDHLNMTDIITKNLNNTMKIIQLGMLKSENQYSIQQNPKEIAKELPDNPMRNYFKAISEK